MLFAMYARLIDVVLRSPVTSISTKHGGSDSTRLPIFSAFGVIYPCEAVYLDSRHKDT